MSFDCEYCKTSFKSLSSLNYHIKNAKYCLLIQGKNTDKTVKQKDFTCNFCNKILCSKRNLNNHVESCEKDFKNILKYETRIKELEKQLQIQKESYIEQIEIYKNQNLILQQTIERLSTKAIEKPTTTNNTINNNLNITTTIDFDDIDKIKYIIEEDFNINYAVDGQKGIANFLADKFLKDENGNLIYICTDPSRYVFKYRDSSGEFKKDLEAKKLTNYIIQGGIKKKAVNVSNEWYTNENGDIDMEKFTIVMDYQQSILKIKDDNAIFKRELATITTT